MALPPAVGGTGVAEMLFCTALVALVGAGEQPAFSPRSLHIANTKVCWRYALRRLLTLYDPP